MNETSNDKTTLSLDFNRNRIRLSKPMLRRLGNPANVQLLVNPESRLIALKAIDRAVSGDQTYKIPWKTAANSHCIEITSQPLMQLLQNTFSEFDVNRTSQLTGIIVPSERIVLYSIDTVRIVPREINEDE